VPKKRSTLISSFELKAGKCVHFTKSSVENITVRIRYNRKCVPEVNRLSTKYYSDDKIKNKR